MTSFLIDASLPRDAATLVRVAGYKAVDVRDIGLGTSSDLEIDAHAQSQHLCLISRDLDFGDVRNYPPEQRSGIIIIRAPQDAGRAIVLGLLDRFLREAHIIQKLSGRLAVVSNSGIRLRPA